ncbi:putative DNA/RNA polymerase superfamily [Helianthus debilis subsp. tardiflorus]
MSCTKAQKYLRKGYVAFLAHVVEEKGKSKSIQDIPIVRDYPEVFPDKLPGLPPVRQVEFHIDLVPNANPIAKAPYRLAPSEMQELSKQLQELSDKGFIRPSYSPWGCSSPICEKIKKNLSVCVSIIVSSISSPSRIDVPYHELMISLISCKVLHVFPRSICVLGIISFVYSKKIFPKLLFARDMVTTSSLSCLLV